MQEILRGWVAENPFGLNESLLAMKAYAPFHQLYAVSMCFAIQSNQSERAPQPVAALEKSQTKGMKDQIVQIAGTCINTALEAAANEPQPKNRVFSPQNWIKTKACLTGINAAIRQYFAMLPGMPGGKEMGKTLKEALTLPPEEFEYRWAAD